MFVAHMYGHTQVYSTRFNAERAIAFAINSRPGFLTEDCYKEFLISYRREDYASAVAAYNKHARVQFYCNQEYLATITEVNVDEKFV